VPSCSSGRWWLESGGEARLHEQRARWRGGRGRAAARAAGRGDGHEPVAAVAGVDTLARRHPGGGWIVEAGAAPTPAAHPGSRGRRRPAAATSAATVESGTAAAAADAALDSRGDSGVRCGGAAAAAGVRPTILPRDSSGGGRAPLGTADAWSPAGPRLATVSAVDSDDRRGAGRAVPAAAAPTGRSLRRGSDAATARAATTTSHEERRAVADQRRLTAATGTPTDDKAG